MSPSKTVSTQKPASVDLFQLGLDILPFFACARGAKWHVHNPKGAFEITDVDRDHHAGDRIARTLNVEREGQMIIQHDVVFQLLDGVLQVDALIRLSSEPSARSGILQEHGTTRKEGMGGQTQRSMCSSWRVATLLATVFETCPTHDCNFYRAEVQ